VRSRPRAFGWGRAITVGALAVIGTGSAAHAQQRGQQPQRFQPEARIDFLGARASAAHIGVGVSIPANTYVRIGVVGAVGQAWRNGVSSGAGRIDGLVRFVVDPLREFRWAPYAAGGLSAVYDRADEWRAVLVGVLGVEGPAGGGVVPAIEAGFGGGVRVGVALRRAMRNRR
jgi:hypothetical protein